MLKKFIAGSVLVFLMGISTITIVEARRSGGYYKSASSGRFVSKSYYNSHPSTTYKSYKYR
ncbi:hypothetical protein K9L27_02010 [Candidatus Gracilibacteria bacterium]|nr:hypothetical protein [Candidatus Gracilibacteria bacterium]